jgi:hypothetical protein
MIVKARKKSLDEAAEELASIAQAHLATLPPAERSKRLAAFRRVVTNAGAARAKREERRNAQASRDLSQVR